MEEHARVQPSGLHTTVPCPGSLTLQELAPKLPESEEAQEGKAAHRVCSAYLCGELWPVGHRFTHGGREWTVDIDMVGGARQFVEAVRFDPMAQIFMDQRVTVTRIHHSECWGRLDGGAYSRSTNTLVLVEYKYGFVIHEPFEHWQLMAYAEGLIETLQLNDQELTVIFKVVQPRAPHADGPVREWRVPAVELRPLLNTAAYAVGQALNPDPPTTTGTHCMGCDARTICKTLARATSHIVEFTGRAELDVREPVTLGQELRILDDALEHLKARRNALEVQAEHVIKRGGRVPFYTLRALQARLNWREGTTVEEIAQFGDMLGVNLRKSPELITPTQCTKLGVDPGIIGEFAVRESSGMKLTRDSAQTIRKLFNT